MSGARDHVLGAIRRGLGRGPEEPAHTGVRLDAHPRGPVPAAAGGDRDALRERFVTQARAASAEVESLEAGTAGLPALVARICAAGGFAPRAAIAPDPALTERAWAEAGVAVEARAAGPEDRVCVSTARCGVAETGTLVLTSGPASPTTLNFLPDLHVVLLEAGTIVGSYEAAWDQIRAAGPLPRTVNWITGPSRSADIEQRLQLGAHGPVRLVIALA